MILRLFIVILVSIFFTGEYSLIPQVQVQAQDVAVEKTKDSVTEGFNLKDDQKKTETIDIVQGMEKIYSLDFVPYEDLRVANENILKVIVIKEKKELSLTGLKPGMTNITVRDTYTNIRLELIVNITSTNQSEQVAELKEYLGDIEGLEIGIKGKNVYIGGQIVVPDDLGRITTILEKYPDVVQLFELSPQTQEIIAGKMQDEMKKYNLKDVTIRVVNKTFWLEGVVPSETDRVLAQKIAEYLAPDRVQTLSEGSNRIMTVQRNILVNLISVKPPKEQEKPPPKMIKIAAQFVELSKDYSKVFGFKWLPTLSSGGGNIAFGKTTNNGVTTKSNGTFSGTISNLLPHLASAKSAGYARIIQSGMILVMDRAKASVSKKSTVPFVLGTGEFQRTMTVQPEFSVNVRPEILSKEAIQLLVGVSVSLSQGSASTGNKIETSLVVNSQETAVVGGIAINEGQTSYDKDPPFGKDEVDPQTGAPLFSFLKSKYYAITKSQFVVFLTPEIVDSPAKATMDIKEKFRQRRR
jgi:pilus assembly protein CpaC